MNLIIPNFIRMLSYSLVFLVMSCGDSNKGGQESDKPKQEIPKEDLPTGQITEGEGGEGGSSGAAVVEDGDDPDVGLTSKPPVPIVLLKEEDCLKQGLVLSNDSTACQTPSTNLHCRKLDLEKPIYFNESCIPCDYNYVAQINSQIKNCDNQECTGRIQTLTCELQDAKTDFYFAEYKCFKMGKVFDFSSEECINRPEQYEQKCLDLELVYNAETGRCMIPKMVDPSVNGVDMRNSKKLPPVTHALLDQITMSDHSYLSDEEKYILTKSYIECGIAERIGPACFDSPLRFSNDYLITMPLFFYFKNYAHISGTEVAIQLARFESNGKSVLMIHSKYSKIRESIKLYGFPYVPNRPIDLTLSRLQRFIQDSTSHDIAQDLIDVLNAFEIGEVIPKLMVDNSLLSEIETKIKEAKSLKIAFHLSQFAQTHNFEQALQTPTEKPLVELFEESDDFYRDQYLDLLMQSKSELSEEFLSRLKAVEEVENDQQSLKGKLALIQMKHAKSNISDARMLTLALNFLKSSDNKDWLQYGISLFPRYQGQFGNVNDLVQFAQHTFSEVRIAAAAALPNYTEQIAKVALIVLAADQDKTVRDRTKEIIESKGLDIGAFNLLRAFVTNLDDQIQSDLAEALSKVEGEFVGSALLYIASNLQPDTRKSAIKVIIGKNLDLHDQDIYSLIQSADIEAVKDFTRMLKFVKGEHVGAALLKLAANIYESIGYEALLVLEEKKPSIGNFDIVELINNTADSIAKKNLATAMLYVKGDSVVPALRLLSTDLFHRVRQEAIRVAGILGVRL